MQLFAQVRPGGIAWCPFGYQDGHNAFVADSFELLE
jgi:hypothetical protein